MVFAQEPSSSSSSNLITLIPSERQNSITIDSSVTLIKIDKKMNVASVPDTFSGFCDVNNVRLGSHD